MKLMPNNLFAREHTSDEGTWHDVFDKDKAWHRPSINVKVSWGRPIIFDLGSYVGYTPIDLQELYPNARVIAVEPDWGNFKTMVLNVAVRKFDIPMLNYAVSCHDGFCDVRGEAFNAKQVDHSLNGTIRAITIDSLMSLTGVYSIDYIKMDIEGLERNILKTPAKWPSVTKAIKVELHNGYTTGQCANDLTELGFSCASDYSHGNAVFGWKKYV